MTLVDARGVATQAVDAVAARAILVCGARDEATDADGLGARIAAIRGAGGRRGEGEREGDDGRNVRAGHASSLARSGVRRDRAENQRDVAQPDFGYDLCSRLGDGPEF